MSRSGMRLGRSDSFWSEAIYRVLGGVITLVGVVLFVLVFGANWWGCISNTWLVGHTRAGRADFPEIVEPDERVKEHIIIRDRLVRIWRAGGGDEEQLRLAIARSSDLNAASFGDGRFIVWEGVGTLPESALDCVMAHEVAHDLLLHSLKAQELSDLMEFFADVVGFGGADRDGEKILKDWFKDMSLPKYSRSQEFEADREALGLLRSVGYESPDFEMSGTLEILLERHGNTGGGFLDYHPSTEERIHALVREDAAK